MQEVPQDSDIVRSSQQQKLFYAQNELSEYVTGEDFIDCMGIVFTEEYECGFFGMVYYSCQGSSPWIMLFRTLHRTWYLYIAS